MDMSRTSKHLQVGRNAYVYQETRVDETNVLYLFHAFVSIQSRAMDKNVFLPYDVII